jgi:4-hydroxy-tetrahydrodipicolinate synthase
VAILESCRSGRWRSRAGRRRHSRAQHVRVRRAARRAPRSGCDGLMVLPPYVYRGDWRETRAHFRCGDRGDRRSRACCTTIPIAYGTDVSAGAARGPRQLRQSCMPVKESSGDVRRVTAVLERLGRQAQRVRGAR